jgi:hypothetical protein
LGFAQQLRELGDIRRNSPRLIFAEQFRRATLNARREAARIVERCNVLAARSIGHPRLEVARRSRSTAPRREAARNMTVRNIAPEAARITRWTATAETVLH